VKPRYAPLDAFVPILASTDKWQAIEELVGALEPLGLVRDGALALRDLLDRERSLSTGMTDGLAIPHARTRSVTRRCVALGLSPAGMDFDSIDGRPAHVVLLALTPKTGAWPHLEYLADLARAYSDPVWRAELASCGSLEEARAVLQRKL